MKNTSFLVAIVSFFLMTETSYGYGSLPVTCRAEHDGKIVAYCINNGQKGPKEFVVCQRNHWTEAIISSQYSIDRDLELFNNSPDLYLVQGFGRGQADQAKFRNPLLLDSKTFPLIMVRRLEQDGSFGFKYVPFASFSKDFTKAALKVGIKDAQSYTCRPPTSLR